MTTLCAPAKLNLTLEVLARRVDGYHGVRSVMVPLDLADEVAIKPSRCFSFACSDPQLDAERNLAVAALRALGDLPPVRIVLRKRVPVQAGLGGGSSDAAAMLRAAMRGLFGPQPRRDWLNIARTLGSDVPFFLAETGALVEGTGERVTPTGALPQWHALIVKPPVAISTAAAYAALDSAARPRRARSGSVSLAALEALQRGDFDRVESLLQNDFQDAVASSSPEVAAALRSLRSAGAGNALLTGSGSCVFTIAPERAHVERVLERLALPPEYERYAAAFGQTPHWRAA